jgi:uncharacterized protein
MHPEESVIITELKQVPQTHALVFAALCCERMLPNYQRFVQEHGEGDYTVLREGLDLVWEYVLGRATPEQAQAASAACNAVTPDTEDFPTISCSLASDAGVAMLHTLDFCADGDGKHAIYVSTLLIDAVAMYVDGKDLEGTRESLPVDVLDQDPLVMAERKRQLDDLAWLKAHPVLDESDVAEIRARYRGMSNLQ